VWLLVGIAICNDKSMADIVNQLYIVEQTDKPFIASSALTQHGKVSIKILTNTKSKTSLALYQQKNRSY
jgi:hypothetical protein